jgi:hypothetical protein
VSPRSEFIVSTSAPAKKKIPRRDRITLVSDPDP